MKSHENGGSAERKSVSATSPQGENPARETPSSVLGSSEDGRGARRPIRAQSGEPVKPDLTPNAVRVLEKRYLRRNEEGRTLETPEFMFRRVAKHVASADLIYDPDADVEARQREFYEMIARLEFLPNSPTLMNAGRELGQLSACFVLPVEDSMESIFEAIKNTALIHKSGGGTGFSFSRIRPRNDVVKSTKGVSSGPISFMTVFDAATETIKQGGTRRGANMAVLRVDHPDILDFIVAKEREDRLNNFNLSVGITDAFMDAVLKDNDYDLVNPHNKHVVKRIRARQVFDTIVQLAWKNGDPGIVFLDKVNRDNPTPALGEIESTNPCGEQPLLPYESCNLGSVNLSRMVRTNGSPVIDFEKLRRVVNSAVRFLDNVIDVNRYPLEIIKTNTLGNRKIGLGVMGFADMLIKLGIPYDSDKAVEAAESVMSFIQEEAHGASEAIARERGPFPNYGMSTYAQTGGPKLRNATVTTIAPTGSLSIIAGCSSGIEPIFAVSFVRKNVLDDDELVEVNPLFSDVAKMEGFFTPELMREIAEKGSVRDVQGVPERVKGVFVTAHDITPEWHVRMQAAFQKHTDNAVSKTVNFPNKATPSDVQKVYMLAHELGCKGVTIYRDASRKEQVLNRGSGADTNAPQAEPGAHDPGDEEEAKAAGEREPRVIDQGEAPTVDSHGHDEPAVMDGEAGEPHAGQVRSTPRPRPQLIHGSTRKMSTGCGNLYVTVNQDELGPFEIFSQMGKAGGCAASQSEAISRLVSLALRSGISPQAITKQLKGISCHLHAWQNGTKTLSCSDAIAKALEMYLKGEEVISRSSEESVAGLLPLMCPECGNATKHAEGCVVCVSCGYSKCY
jgi:ribonucleoside-diphosphate reductase alpha chain